MKNRLLSDERIDYIVDTLADSVYNARIDYDNTISWKLFYHELFMNDKNVDTYDTGAIASAISALCNSKSKRNLYRPAIKKACELLKKLRNENGSWSVTSDLSTSEKQGIVYNSVISLEALIDAGELDLNEMGPDYLEKSVDFVFETIEWIYTQRIFKKDTLYYGWGYSGDSENKIYIMPTVNVLISLKRVYFEVATKWKNKLSEKRIDGKKLLDIINEVQESLYSFRISPEIGWGKEITETNDRIVYTLYGLYGLVYSVDSIEDIEYPNAKLSDEDVNNFTEMICRWNRKKYFNWNQLDTLEPEDFFDTYIQKTDSDNNGSCNEIIDHESFFETIAMVSIVEFIKKYKNKIKKAKQGEIFEVLVKLSIALKERICIITINENYSVVRSRRGLLSQSYPVYTITQTINALTTLKENKKNIKDLMKYRRWIIKGLGFIIQVLGLFIINSFAIPNTAAYIIIFVSLLAPLSEGLKNWMFNFSELEE